MAESWLTIEQVCRATEWSVRHIRREAAKSGWTARNAECRGKNGKHERLYALSSLPAAAQIRHAELTTEIRVGPTNITVKEANPIAESLPLFDAPNSGPFARPAILAGSGWPEGQRVHLHEADLATATKRLAAIQPMLDFKARTNGRRPAFKISPPDGAGHVLVKNLNDLAGWLARQHEVSKTTLWNWYMRFRAGGFAALAPRARSDRGASKIFGRAPEQIPDDAQKRDAELAKLTPAGRRAAHLYLAERFSARMVWETLEKEFAAVRPAEAPSYGAVRNFVNALPRGIVRAALAPAKQFEAHHAPYVLRDFSTARVMEWWVLDHAEDDFFVYNDYIESLDRHALTDAPPNAWLRMWMTAFMDVRSRFVIGYAFCAIPSSTSICSALRMGVLRAGRVPKFGLLDRGEDMKKVARQKPGMPEAARGALIRLIQQQHGHEGGVIHSIGEHPQSKPIESWFGTKRKRFDRNLATWCGARPEERPDSCQKLLDAHEHWMKTQEGASPLPKASEAIAATVYWIEQKYNREHKHSGSGMGGRTPEQVWRNGYAPAEQQRNREQLDPRTLDEFLWAREERKVFAGGCVRMFDAEFEPADDASLAVLRAWDDRQVLVAADPHNVGDAIAIDPATGHKLGDLVSKKLLAWGESRDTIRAKVRAQRRAMRSLRGMAAAFGERDARTFGFLGAGFPGNSSEAKVAIASANRPMLSAPAARHPEGRALAPARPGGPAFVQDAVEQSAEHFLEIAQEGD